ncbi:Probable chitinase 10 [Anthophora retusa]
MSFILILFTLVLGLCNSEARRTTTTTSTLTTFDKIGEPQRGRQADLENVWDLVELQKLDNHANVWNKESSQRNTTESQDPDAIITKQLYPTVPNPGDTNELPGPIPPGFVTIKPIPVVTPAPGCYAPRGQFPNPRNCAGYLNCWDDIVTEQLCPDGLLFNDYTLVCDYDYNVNCGSRPLPTPKPSLPSETEPCPDPNGRYRSATNCSEFYVCVYRKPIKFSCPRGLVYNELLGVCDYPYNVDCKGAATPALPLQTLPQTELPSLPPQPPTYAPPYQPLQPSPLPPQPPVNELPQQPSYGPSQPSSYPLNPWLSKTEPDPWHQRPVSSQLEINKQQAQLQENLDSQQEQVEHFQNPWNVLQGVPASLSMVPCKNGDMHRLNDPCTNVVVCRNGRPQLVQCSVGLTYDKASDSCKPFSIAKW